MSCRHPLSRLPLAALWLICLTLLAPAARADRSPLPVADLPGVYQRVLTLPGAALFSEPAGREVERPPVFTVLYVYDRVKAGGETWLEVGRSSLGQTDGFIRGNETQEWQHMLVMRFAPRGARSRVLFFRDKATLADLARSARSKSLVEGLEAGVDEGKPDTDILAAVEPATAVSYEDQPYLLPIVDFQEVRAGGRDWTTLVNVAGLNATAGAESDSFDQSGAGKLQPELNNLRIGVVFVVDTTRSMKPYLDRIYSVVAETYKAFENAGEIDNVSFGLVAFRDNVTPDPRIGYVTKVVLPLSLYGQADEILTAIGHVDVSPVSTQGWNEDAFAGLHEALTGLDWKGFGPKLMVLVTDAGARPGNDPMAKYPGIDVQSLKEEAAAKHIALFPIHLLTDEAERAGNVITAQRQYRALAQTGDLAIDKYLDIPAKPIEPFTTTIEAFSDGLVESAVRASKGLYARDPGEAPPVKSELGVKEMVINEIFRAQLEYLGAERQTKAPAFYRAWASDHDLLAPDRRSLEVAVFLTRTQLNALGSQLHRILDLAKEGKSSAEHFFDGLQDLAARTSYDPTRPPWTKDQTIGEAGLLPAYLAKLPYHSDVLELSESTWLSFGLTGQQEFIDNLEYKLTAYEDMATFDNWVDLGAGDIGLEVYPVPLSLLP